MLNNKGVTTIEVLICFVLVTIISTSLFSTVSMFNDNRKILLPMVLNQQQ